LLPQRLLYWFERFDAMADRRTFLKTAAALGLAAGSAKLVGCGGEQTAVDAGTDAAAAFRRSLAGSQVVSARDENALRDGQVNRVVVRRLVAESVKRLTGASSEADAWRALFSPEDTVGIKVNCLAGPMMCTRPEVVDAVVEGLTGAGGIPAKQIIIWDRFNRELEKCGYTIRTSGSGPLCFGTDSRGAGYEPQPLMHGSIGSCFSTILTRRSTALLNMPVLKDHDLAGVTIGMKNFYGTIHNPNKYHDNNCDPYIADLSASPPIRSRLRLVVCDALAPQCHAGPAYREQFVWQRGGILVARDPVALDAVGARIIEEQRRAKGMPSLDEQKRPPRYIQSAEALEIGWARKDKIRLVEV